MNDPIYVTKTYLPDLSAYTEVLETAWSARHVANNGPLSQKLEQRLRDHLGVDHLMWVTSGTMALQLAIRALGLTGEIITTPLTYIATATSIVWEHCTPVFVDIEADGYNIDVQAIEAAINERTTGIMAVHTYGYPCDVHLIQALADQHDLKVVYDAAHAFAVEVDGESILDYGDMATLSFHATKVYHTGEGGAVIANDYTVRDRLDLMRSFGHRYDSYLEVGINAKNTELHAALGLLNLDIIDSVIADRRLRYERYMEMIDPHMAIIRDPATVPGLKYNYGYAIVQLPTEEALLDAMARLEAEHIYPRRYFYPALNELDYLNPSDCPRCSDVARRVLALPLYHDLALDDVDRIADIINRQS